MGRLQLTSLTFPHLWIPRRKLWTPWDACFTAGKAQRKSDGKTPRKTSSGTAGKTPRNTGSPSSCCCGCDITGQTNCPGGLASGTFLGVVSGSVLTSCVATNDCSGGAPSAKSDFAGTTTLDGSYCFIGGTDWTFIADDITVGGSGLGGSCGLTAARKYRYHLSRLSSTVWNCVGTFFTPGFPETGGPVHFYSEATVADCSSDFSMTNFIISQTCYVIPNNCFGLSAGTHVVSLGWNGSISFVHCGC